MNDHERLLREDATDFERQLLSAVMRERPSPQLHRRMRRTLGLTGPLAWASSVKAMLATLAGKAVVGTAVVGLVAAGAVYAGSSVVSGAATSGPVTSGAATSGPATSGPAAAESPGFASGPAAAVLEPAAPSEQLEPSTAVSSRELREEILLLDQVRVALQRGASAAALEHLDQYGQRFPSGVLSREAAQLRQQANVRNANVGRRR
jgi:hypothetical protein